MLRKIANLGTYPTLHHRILLDFYDKVKVNCMNILFSPGGRLGGGR